VSVERAVQHTIASEPELVRSTANAVPKAWGTLAARGVLAFREIVGRPPSDVERRAIWASLWERVRRTHDAGGRATCGHAIDPGRHGICEVCGGMLLCVECARAHYCTSACGARGCVAGLCVKEVRDGLIADTFGLE